MPVDKGFVAHVTELLTPLGGITGKAMFGGYGWWHDGQMFALLDKDSTLYLKVDDRNRTAFEAEGSGPFAPPVPAGRAPMTMPYYEVPSTVLDEGEALREWARAAIEVAHATPPKAPRARRK
jgi:DNA transformation protein and related proteins